MYDDDHYSRDSRYDSRYEAGANSYNSWKDKQRSSPRGPGGGRTYNSRNQDDSYYGRERSRSPQRGGRGRYVDRDREGYRSPRRDSRSRSPYFGGPPSHTVIFEGIPLEMTQEDISNELHHRMRAEGLEEVRLIKDKRTGISRQFAFAQFISTSQARRFLEQYYPAAPFYDVSNRTTEPTMVRIAFSREKDNQRPGMGEDDWKCEVCSFTNYAKRIQCLSCNAPRTRSTAHGVVVPQSNMSTFSGFATTGDSDASPDGNASQFLLFRGLEPGVNEDILVKGVSKLYRAKGDQIADSTPKKSKISSTSTDANQGAKEGSLRRILLVRDRKTDDSWRYGFAEFNTVEDAQAAMAKYKALEKFTIASKSVLVSYIHAGVFVPVLYLVDERSAKFTFTPLSNSSTKLMYWDEAAYVNELFISENAPGDSSKEVPHRRSTTASGADGLSADTSGEPRSKKRKIEKESSATKKVLAPHLQFWTNRHAEIHGIQPKDFAENSEDISSTKTAEAEIEGPPAESFADMNRLCCLLCARQFKTRAEVHKHERVSQLHRDNMKIEELIAKAHAKLDKAKAKHEAGYRDRAMERRKAFNQPKQAPPAQTKSKGYSVESTTSKDEEKDSDPSTVPAQSKGAQLLGKMGWTAGAGLGAQGTGRTEAIATELYTQGVGLGAEGGKVGDAAEEASRRTKGTYADFLSKTKDKAKERYESMGQ